jgi:hypothetical protein
MWKGEFVFISEALVGELVGIAELETGDYIVRVCDLDIGLIGRRGRFVRFAPPRSGSAKRTNLPLTKTCRESCRFKMSKILPVEQRCCPVGFRPPSRSAGQPPAMGRGSFFRARKVLRRAGNCFRLNRHPGT